MAMFRITSYQTDQKKSKTEEDLKTFRTHSGYGRGQSLQTPRKHQHSVPSRSLRKRDEEK